jgi:hypothetical protein
MFQKFFAFLDGKGWHKERGTVCHKNTKKRTLRGEFPRNREEISPDLPASASASENVNLPSLLGPKHET